MKDSIPKVVFKYAFPLDGNRRQMYAKKDRDDYPSYQEIREEVEHWRKLWKELNKNDQVIKRIIELTGIIYPRDIEAYIIGAGLNPMSRPLILPVRRKVDKENTGAYEELILHELLHRFVGDREAAPQILNYWNRVKEKHQEESKLTQHHIIVYALLIKLLSEFVPEADIDELVGDDWTDYQRALEIVREEGSDKIIAEFQELTQGSNE